MNLLNDLMPERCFDVGIAEGHAVTYAAGAAAGGMIPFCNIYSSFMQRAYDNVIHDVAIQNLPVVLCLDRGGLVGEDGATHHGVFDLAYFSTIPNLVVAAPRDELELRNMMYTALKSNTPFSIRYPRGTGAGVAWRDESFEMLPIGRGVKLRSGDRVAILTIGATSCEVDRALELYPEALGWVAHYDMRYAKPLDTHILDEVGANFKSVITIEDGAIRGGVGESIAAYFNANSLDATVITLGVPDRFIEHATPSELREECGFDAQSIVDILRNI